MIGEYKGVFFMKQRICDVMYCFKWRSKYYFTYEADRKTPTGSMFRTLREMYAWIDEEQLEK